MFKHAYKFVLASAMTILLAAGFVTLTTPLIANTGQCQALPDCSSLSCMYMQWGDDCEDFNGRTQRYGLCMTGYDPFDGPYFEGCRTY